jgi:hypothetical protein
MNAMMNMVSPPIGRFTGRFSSAERNGCKKKGNTVEAPVGMDLEQPRREQNNPHTIARRPYQ